MTSDKLEAGGLEPAGLSSESSQDEGVKGGGGWFCERKVARVGGRG